MEIQLLEQIGLSKREIRVYSSLIDLGQTTTGPLVKKSGVPNSKVYEILEKLINKGLVSYIIKGKTKYFQTTDPKNLLYFLDEKRGKVNELVCELEKKKQGQDTQEAFIYEGIQGVKAAFNHALDVLKKGDEICVFSMGTELATDELRLFWKEHFRKRLQKGISTRAIPHISLRKTFPRYYGKYKILFRFTKNKLPEGVFIYKNHVLTFLWGEKPTAYVIKSSRNYKSYVNFFEQMWNVSKK
ncbi:MAG: helix-turn-helix domain-containing protein [Nanoarchaeota archaeon]|nr:helix-turn-helix domain-containing protein [Nanoarchaeota archaeon]